jgi:histidinol-phosphate phosphatase family protein
VDVNYTPPGVYHRSKTILSCDVKRAAFLDRDGVLNERPPAHEYLADADALRVIPGVPEAVARLEDAGYVPIVVSNQRGIARLLVSPGELLRIEQRLQSELARAGASITAFYYCPHELDSHCNCRKPAPGLLLRAADEHGIDLRSSVLFGDSEADEGAASAVGCRAVRVGEGGEAPDLLTAVTRLLAADPPNLGGGPRVGSAPRRPP